MFAYVDTSVLLRLVLREEEAVTDFSKFEYTVSSELIRVEALRTLDRHRLQNSLAEDEFVTRVSLLHEAIARLELIRITHAVLSRASQPFPTVIGTLDAIHLSSCLLFSERNNKPITLCSHDSSLKNAARAMGLEVFG